MVAVDCLAGAPTISLDTSDFSNNQAEKKKISQPNEHNQQHAIESYLMTNVLMSSPRCAHYLLKIIVIVRGCTEQVLHVDTSMNDGVLCGQLDIVIALRVSSFTTSRFAIRYPPQRCCFESVDERSALHLDNTESKESQF